MKKILSVIILLALTATVVHAASVNGDFKGNPIVKVKSNGKELTVENTPAVIYNDNTLVPIYMLRQLGATVTWDAKTYSVDVSLPKSESSTFSNGVSISDINSWAYVASYYSELDSLASTFYITLGSFNFLTSTIVYNQNDAIVPDLIESLKNTLASIDTDLVRIVDSHDNTVREKLILMNVSNRELNSILEGYDTSIADLYDAYNKLFDYYYKGKRQSDLDSYQILFESATKKIDTSHKVAKDQFSYWINGVIQQQP